MAKNVAQVGQSSKETEEGASNVAQTATQLSSLANKLENLVQQFKTAS
jgi:methyl-accepting chemotaxis protein